MARPSTACALSALALALCACGARSADRDTTAPRARSTLPRTDRDPLPYAAVPRPRGTTGETVTLLASGGEDQARRMLPILLRALRDADETRLEALLAPVVFQAARRRRGGSARPRAALVQRMLIYARRSLIPASTPIEELVELDAVDVRRAVSAYPQGGLPELVQSTDLVVEVPIREAGRTPLRALLGWHLRGRMVVRPGGDPRIIAL